MSTSEAAALSGDTPFVLFAFFSPSPIDYLYRSGAHPEKVTAQYHLTTEQMVEMTIIFDSDTGQVEYVQLVREPDHQLPPGMFASHLYFFHTYP